MRASAIRAVLLELERLYNLKPHPGDDKVDNIKEAQKQQDQLRVLLDQARKHFEAEFGLANEKAHEIIAAFKPPD